MARSERGRAQAHHGRRHASASACAFETCHCTTRPIRADSETMSNRALLIIPLLFACAAVRAGDFKLYAVLTEDTRVELSDGAVWQMDKGDVFPIEAYKNQQKNIVL